MIIFLSIQYHLQIIITQLIGVNHYKPIDHQWHEERYCIDNKGYNTNNGKKDHSWKFLWGYCWFYHTIDESIVWSKNDELVKIVEDQTYLELELRIYVMPRCYPQEEYTWPRIKSNPNLTLLAYHKHTKANWSKETLCGS